jgi:hypothetical protein
MRYSQGILVIASALVSACTPTGIPDSKTPSRSGGTASPKGGTGGSSNGGAGGDGGGSTSSQNGNGGKAGSGGSGGNVTTSGSGGASGAGGTSGAGGSGGTTIETSCVPGVPATSQIPRMKDAAYDGVVKDLLGLTALTSAGNQPPSSLLAPDSDGALTDIGWNGYLTAAEKIAAEVMAGSNKSKFISCDPATNTTTCLTNTIKTFGRKAFRRPLTDAEVTSLLRLNSLTPKGTGAEVAEAILYAFLASPSFILLPELAQDKQGSSIKLSSYEVATRLSFLLWGTIPDDTLNTAADGGQLSSIDQIAAQAQRMLKSDKASAVVHNFHRYYAGIEAGSHWVNNSHDSTKYPAFTSGSYDAAMSELDAFFQEVVLKGGTFKDMFLSNVAFVTTDTAALYGLDPASYGTTPTRVQLNADQRPGFLTRVAFLSTFAKYDVTSLILRGAFISGRVIGINPGTPDPTALKTQPPPGNYTTQRQAIEAMTKNEPCFSCHNRTINPPGFVFEHYNAVGMWQDTDPLGGTIDGTGDVRLTPTNTKTISSPLQLMTEISNLAEAKHRYAEQWVAFAAARVPNPNDACIVEQMSSSMSQASYTLVNLLADYTKADSFRLRTVGN